MKKYCYVEFTDEAHYGKRGRLYLVADAEEREDYIKELSLEKDRDGEYTTLKKMGELGWELAFVTPCGSFANPNFSEIKNAYVFKKAYEAQ